MDTVRDLGRVEPWRESLERSLARRGKLPRSSIELNQLQPKPDLRHGELVHESTSWSRSRRRGIAKRLRMLVVAIAGLVTLVLVAAILPGFFSGRGVPASATAAHADVSRASMAVRHDESGHAPACPASGDVRAAGACRLVVGSNDYVNPLAGAHVTPERIDQGVDYAGSGTLSAIGAARVTYVATAETGWPGAFIEYQLTGGPDTGSYVYYAEGVSPAPDLHVGETVRPGQPIATIIPDYASGFELGWGAGTGTKTYAAKMGRWNSTDDADSIPSGAGKSFSALIAALGGPPGKAER